MSPELIVGVLVVVILWLLFGPRQTSETTRLYIVETTPPPREPGCAIGLLLVLGVLGLLVLLAALAPVAS